MRLFGALWVLPALGFVLSAIALLAGWASWQPLLVGVTILSLVLTALDWSTAYAGAIFNAVILCLLLLGPRLVAWASR